MSVKTCEEIAEKLISCFSREDFIGVSYSFNQLKTDTERVAQCYNFLRNFDLLPNDNSKLNKKKTASISEKYRNEGNRAFVQKDDMSALYYYTKAIGYALTGSKEISIAHANRSAVTFSLGDFSDAVKDINYALQGDYPDHLKFKLWERKGKALFELGNLLEAQTAFENSIVWLPQSTLNEEKCKLARTQFTLLLQQCAGRNFKTKASKKATLPQLTHGPSPHLQCGSNAIEIKYSPDRGRYLVAKLDINPGDVLVVEKPYSSVPLPNSYFFFCFYCHKRCHSLIPCLYCTLVFFCDEKCLANCWEESHSIECSILPSLFMLNCEKIELLALRILINATEKGKKINELAKSLDEIETFDVPTRKGFTNDIYLSDSYKSIHNLEDNNDLRSVSYLFSRSIYAACILHVLDMNTDFFNSYSLEKISTLKIFTDLEEKTQLRLDKIFAGGLILKYLQISAINGHDISEMRVIPEEEPNTKMSAIGSAAYALLSLLNHSCDPNVTLDHYFGSTSILTATQAIKKGKQIFYNYRYHYAYYTKKERQLKLKSQYLFTCQCIACIDNWPLFWNLPENIPISPLTNVTLVKKSSKKFQHITYYLSLNRLDKLAEWLVFLYSHIKLLQQSITTPSKEYTYCQEAIKQCLSLQADHYVYKSRPLNLMTLRDDEIGDSPF